MVLKAEEGTAYPPYRNSKPLIWSNNLRYTKGVTFNNTDDTAVAPMKITSHTLISTPVAGSLENDGTNLYFTDSALNREKIGPRGDTIVVATSGGDYSDIQSAIDSLSSGTGGHIFVRAGTYTITTGLKIKSQHTWIEGEGAATKLNFDGAVVTTLWAMNDTTQRSNIRIENMQFVSTNASPTGLGIDGSYFAASQFKNLWMVNVNKGIDLNASGTLYNYIENVRISCTGAGAFGIRMDTASNETTIMRVRIAPDANATGVIVNAHGCSLYDVDVETGAAIGIDVQASGHDCTMFAPYLEANVINLKLASGVEATAVFGGTIIDGTTYNIQNLGAKGLDIRAVRLQYEQFTYRESQNGFPAKRWAEPFQVAVYGTSQTFGTAGRTWCNEFELQDAAFIDAIVYTVGSNSAGNVTAGVYGPITTEETPLAAPLLVSSASTAQATASTSQVLTVTKTLARAGRYYVALEGSDTAGTFMRTTGVEQVAGWGFYYDRAGGYGAMTDPCPAVTANVTTLPGLRVRLASLTTV